MSEAGGLQLRVLSGMHAGARAMLAGDKYLLGASEDCDFVLLDPLVQPRHAMLAMREGCWHLDWVAEGDEEPVLAPMRLDPGMAVPLGPIVIAVDAPHAPWPTLEQLVLVPHAPALEPQLPPPSESQDKAAVPTSGLRGLFARGAITTAVAATACLSALGMVASPMIIEHNTHKAAASAPARAASATAEETAQRATIEAALRDMAFGTRARIESTENGWVVHAGVISEMESDGLRSALSRIKPRPMLRASTEEDLRDAMTDLLARLGAEYRGKLTYRYAGEGRVRVEGRVAPGTDSDRLARALATAFPQVREWDNAVDTGQQAAQLFLAQLRSMGWQVAGEWDGHRLDMQVTLQQRDVPRWEQTLFAAAQGEAVPFSASLQFAASAPVPVAVARFTADGKPPFEIRGVVGGDVPYVLLPDGAKLVPGGVVQGWKLSTIAANQIVFENGAKRATFPR